MRLKIINKDTNKIYKNQSSVREYVKLQYKDREQKVWKQVTEKATQDQERIMQQARKTPPRS